ncbi:hypothetical protein BJ166DRAFT_577606 [Pestalotiopsis sp. NC0098]|nr:hypothetical protein BJ166DRAFT_577606 [Pestalotiopsis sp. NC0098]
MATIDLCTYPAGKSPDGIYNFVDPPILGPAVVGVGVALGVVSTSIAAGRLYIDRKQWHPAGYFTLMACLTNIAYTSVICAMYPFHRHIWDIPVCWYTGAALKLPFAQTVLFAPALFFPKAAIMLLYRQLFAVQRRTRIAIDFGLLITLLVYFANIPLAAVYAAPRIGQSWASVLENLQANAHPFALAGVVGGAITTFLDFYIFLLPLPLLYRLQLPLRRRLQLVGIFSFAALGVGASIASLVCRIELAWYSTDSSWLAAITAMCSLIETNIAIIVGCMPAFAQIVTRLVETIGGSTIFKALRSRLGGTSPAIDLEKCSRETPELADHDWLEPHNDPFTDRSPQ